MRARLRYLHGPVVVAMAVVGMVQMSIDDVVDMVAMWNRFVTAAGPVHVVGLMGAAGVIGRAPRGVVAPLTERMFVHVVAMHVV